MRAEEYRRYAEECVHLAKQVSDPKSKAHLLQMAQKWRELAERAEREEGSDEPKT